MNFKKTICLSASAFLIFSLFSCANSDITGYYSANKSNNVYYFCDDGKIYENYSAHSTSRYEIDGRVIRLYNEESKSDILEFRFKKTKNGFKMGELEYIKIDDPFEGEKENEKS